MYYIKEQRCEHVKAVRSDRNVHWQGHKLGVEKGNYKDESI